MILSDSPFFPASSLDLAFRLYARVRDKRLGAVASQEDASPALRIQRIPSAIVSDIFFFRRPTPIKSANGQVEKFRGNRLIARMLSIEGNVLIGGRRLNAHKRYPSAETCCGLRSLRQRWLDRDGKRADVRSSRSDRHAGGPAPTARNLLGSRARTAAMFRPKISEVLAAVREAGIIYEQPCVPSRSCRGRSPERSTPCGARTARQ
jgi:hypothetical protein